jgi:serine protease
VLFPPALTAALNAAVACLRLRVHSPRTPAPHYSRTLLSGNIRGLRLVDFLGSRILVSSLAAVLAVLASAQAYTGVTAMNGSPEQRVQVKFRDGTMIRLRNDVLVSLGNDDVSGLDAVLGRYPIVRIERVFMRPEQDLADDKAQAEARTGQPQPDLNLWFRIILPPDADANALICDLQQLDIVETAYSEPPPAPPPT